MKKFDFWVVWLKVISILFAVFGVVIALLNQTTIFDMAFNNHINPVFWDNTSLVLDTVRFQQWIYGLLGATCVMVGVLIYCLVRYAFQSRQRWAWYCLLVSLILWFAIDTPVSLYFGVIFNVVFNCVLLLAVLLPLCLTRKEFKR